MQRWLLSLSVCLVFLSFVNPARSQPPPPPRPLPPPEPYQEAPPLATSPKQIVEPEPRPSFTTHSVGIREEKKRAPLTGYHFGVLGGVNAFQGGDWRINNLKISERGTTSGFAGIRLGYTWDFGDDLIDQFAREVGNDGLRIGGGVEAEALWVSSQLRPTQAGTKYKLNLDTAVFMMDFLLKVQAGDFRPYVGPGIGLAAIFAHDYNFPGSSSSSDNQLALAYQILAGCDYFIEHDWSLFAEYRYLVFHGVDLYDGAAQFEFEDLEQSLFGVGIRHHF